MIKITRHKRFCDINYKIYFISKATSKRESGIISLQRWAGGDHKQLLSVQRSKKNIIFMSE